MSLEPLIPWIFLHGRKELKKAWGMVILIEKLLK
jgi:hypothetical protein